MTAAQMFEKVLTRLPDFPPKIDFITALQATVEAVTQELWAEKDGHLKVDLSESISEDDTYFTLDSSFLGWDGFPYIYEYYKTIYPIPDVSTKISIRETAIPNWYEMRGLKVYLFPIPSEDITIKGQYFAKPTVISAMSGTIPFDGVYDNAIMELLLIVGQSGLSVTVTPVFQAIVKKLVTEVRHMRPEKVIRWLYPA